MVFVYGFCNGNANAARREYSMRFPNRRLPHKTIFRSTFQRLRETGSFALVPHTDGALASLRNEERSAAILQYFDDVPLDMRKNSWFQLDGCPAHYGRGPRQWLNIHYPDRWIGRAGPVAWPARSPDLTP
ncbi:hypothetical protein RF55_23784 [Lasius niger]|uniref:DUF4817 domain-containing protein n=1 Tax=Lasius niger TaxID=67767 RepID=A0A0J7JWF1_LASNI|nr:hypothetical protein RF55_23784 [Lasius niger]